MNPSIRQLQPLLHVIHCATFFSCIFTRLFMVSPNREQHKQAARQLLHDAFSNSKVHLEALFPHRCAPQQRQTPAFWSRTEFFSQPNSTARNCLLPGNVGVTLKLCASVKDLAIYVIAPCVPIMFVLCEVVRQVMQVDPFFCHAVSAFCIKMLVVAAGLALPHFIYFSCVHRHRMLSPWFASVMCVVCILSGVVFLKPGFMGARLLPPSLRFYSAIMTMSTIPPILLRAFSLDASATRIVLLYVIMQRYAQAPLPALYLTLFLPHFQLCSHSNLLFIIAENVFYFLSSRVNCFAF
jgi:hypothetical protein